MNRRLNERYKANMQRCVENSDEESAHANADKFLESLLLDLGYTEIVALYREVDKWYA